MRRAGIHVRPTLSVDYIIIERPPTPGSLRGGGFDFYEEVGQEQSLNAQ